MVVEFFSLIFLCKKIGILANQKGVNARLWKFYTVCGWMIAQIIGGLFYQIFFGPLNITSFSDIDKIDKSILYGFAAMAWIFAFGGYLIVKAILEKKSNTYDDDINKINVNDLRPPQKN